MKLAIGTALIVLLASSIAYAQEQDKEKDKPAQQEEKKQPEEKKQEPAKEQPKAQEHQQQDRQQQEQQKDKPKAQAQQNEKDRANAEKQQQQTAKQQQQVAKQQQQVAKQQDHGNAQQAQRDGGNRNARRIREEDFHSHFGREHAFRVTRSDNRRFNYGGYGFVYNDPWPAGWSYSDDVYVDEIDGEYYLIDPVHPGIRLMIVVED
jgi:outer membrane biosynthesis protein TonB